MKNSGQEILLSQNHPQGFLISLNYGFIFYLLSTFRIWVWQLSTTEAGKSYIDKLKLSIPVVGNLYRKLYLSRIADNLDTMLVSGIPIVRSLDITSDVVGSKVYKILLKNPLKL